MNGVIEETFSCHRDDTIRPVQQQYMTVIMIVLLNTVTGRTTLVKVEMGEVEVPRRKCDCFESESMYMTW